MVTEKYSLENLCCPNCAGKIEEQVNLLPEVKKCHLDFLTKVLTVETVQGREIEHNIKNIVKSIEPDIQVKPLDHAEVISKSILPLSLYLSGLGILVLLSAYLLNPAENIKVLIFLAAYALSSWKVLYNAVVKAISGRLLDEHFLMSVASIGAIYLGEYPEAVAVMVLYEIGQFFENKAVNKSRNAIQSMLKLKPDVVHRLINEKSSDVLISEIAVNERIAVLPGERIPLDGIVLLGQSTLDTSALTGEALPQLVDEGQQVLSGTMNLTGRLVLKVTSTDADSTVTRILKLVEEATQRKSKTERFITRFAKKYTPAVVLTAIFLALIMPVITQNSFDTWLNRSLIFLIISCPCALIISIPLTNYAAIGAAARKGILLKGSNFIDALARTGTLVYDKTGTLTTGKLSIQEVVPLEGISEEKLIIAAYTCEENSNHPLAQAIRCTYSDSVQIQSSLMHQELHGKGIKAQTVDTVYYAGNRVYLQDLGILNLPAEPVETCIYVAEKEHCLGFITFKDEIKADFPEVIRQLRKFGIRKHIMLTGDHLVQAQKVAAELKLDKFYARLLPDEKLRELESIEKTQSSPVAFVGDGLNDAPVLSRAQIGIAMGAIGNQASIEAADIVLMQDEPHQLLTAVKMARKTRSIMWQNILLALGIKSAVMILGTIGLATLWEAVIADVGVTLLAIINSTRLLRI
jgi:Cd2+/Zn2+-exporting ATPase